MYPSLSLAATLKIPQTENPQTLESRSALLAEAGLHTKKKGVYGEVGSTDVSDFGPHHYLLRCWIGLFAHKTLVSGADRVCFGARTVADWQRNETTE